MLNTVNVRFSYRKLSSLVIGSSADGVRMVPGKVEAVSTWPIPTCLQEL